MLFGSSVRKYPSNPFGALSARADRERRAVRRAATTRGRASRRALNSLAGADLRKVRADIVPEDSPEIVLARLTRTIAAAFRFQPARDDEPTAKRLRAPLGAEKVRLP